jgi:DNA-binding SARP family transcriptional activator
MAPAQFITRPVAGAGCLDEQDRPGMADQAIGARRSPAPDAERGRPVRDGGAPAVLDLFANTGDAVIGVDAGLRIVLINPAARQLLGDVVAVGRSCYEVFDCAVTGNCACWLFERAAAGEPVSQRTMLVRASGSRRELATVSTIVVKPAASPAPYLVHIVGRGQSAVAPPPRDIPALAICCLGDFRLLRHGQPVDLDGAWKRKKFRSVFKYLLTHRGRWVSRDELVDVFWPDLEPRAAFHNLRVTLSGLRRALEPELAAGEPSRYLLVQDDMVRLRVDSGVWFDVAVFEEGVRQAVAQPAPLADDALAQLERVVSLYHGDYLPADLYEDWAAGERQRLLDCYSAALRRLAREHLARGRVERAIDLWQQLVQRNPADEETQRALMAALASAGRRPEAIQRYQALVAFLRRELAVAPLPETTRLYQEILAGCAPPAGAGRPAPAALPRR